MLLLIFMVVSFLSGRVQNRRCGADRGLGAPGDLDAFVAVAGLELAFDLHGRSVPFLVECRGGCGMGYGLGAPGDLDAFVAVASLDLAFDLHIGKFSCLSLGILRCITCYWICLTHPISAPKRPKKNRALSRDLIFVTD
ncbi:MAG: hypothetical protein JST65_10025 [Acidobacteria bacterium]|nr:hypothetical protein [Acidobacteriota bacterium]